MIKIVLETKGLTVQNLKRENHTKNSREHTLVNIRNTDDHLLVKKEKFPNRNLTMLDYSAITVINTTITFVHIINKCIFLIGKFVASISLSCSTSILSDIEILSYPITL